MPVLIALLATRARTIFPFFSPSFRISVFAHAFPKCLGCVLSMLIFFGSLPSVTGNKVIPK